MYETEFKLDESVLLQDSLRTIEAKVEAIIITRDGVDYEVSWPLDYKRRVVRVPSDLLTAK